MSFSPAQLLEQLAHCPTSRCFWVAFSGGCDSHALLHSLSQLRQEFSQTQIRAIHVNHGLSSQADQWVQHCTQTCQDLDIPLDTISVNAQAQTGESPEAAARHARYQAFAQTIDSGDILLLAQHRDDQAETLLLQLFRGSGPQGLAAMPRCREFAAGWLFRPLLEFSRDDLRDYAKTQQLRWLEDPSNVDTSFDRNYLRQKILPQLISRWPSINRTLARAAQHQSEVMQLTQQLAQRDWQLCGNEAHLAQLRIAPFQALNKPEQTNLLRYWIKDINGLPVPNQQRLKHIHENLLSAAEDAQPVIAWGEVQLRRFQGELYLLKNQDISLNAKQKTNWDLETPLRLSANRQLVIESATGSGLKTSLQGENVQIRYRQGGETCRPYGRGHSMRLKNLMQEWSIPPWQRALIPLIYIDNEIAAVADYCVCEPFAAAKNEDGLKIMLKTIS